jgi:hypothetical protein
MKKKIKIDKSLPLVNNNLYKPNYDVEKVDLEEFITSFTDRNIKKHQVHNFNKYMIELVSELYFKLN